MLFRTIVMAGLALMAVQTTSASASGAAHHRRPRHVRTARPALPARRIVHVAPRLKAPPVSIAHRAEAAEPVKAVIKP